MILEAIIFGFVVAFLSFSFLGWKDGEFSLSKTLTVNGIGTIGGGILLSFWFYLFPPAFVGLWGGYFRILALPMLIGSVICAFISMGDEDTKGTVIQIAKILAVIITGVVIAFTPVFHADELYDMPEVTVIEDISVANGVLDPIDTKHVRLVDKDLAYSLAQNIMGTKDNLGSIYEVKKGELHIQIINDHEYWVAPLEFQSIWIWNAKRTSPGFIMIDAEDPFAEAEMYTGYEMRYMPSAFLGSYLHRHVYSQGYSNVKLEDFTFEVTDNLNPRWTITTTVPTINNDGYVVKSLLVVNPESGEVKEYLPENAPEWVDRVTPERIAVDYATWYGEYGISWWNAHGFIGALHEDVNEVTSVSQRNGDSLSSNTQEMFFVYGSDGRPYWFSGMTSHSSADQSLTGIILFDVKDPGKAFYIKMTGANEQAALDAINSKYTNFPDRYGTALIPYNVYGILTYIIPVDSHTDSGNVFQGVGFVDAKAKQAIVGDTKEKALELYKSYLATRGIKRALTSGSTEETITAIVERTGDVTTSGVTSYRLRLNGSDAIFSISPNLFPVVVLTEVNDKITISYSDTGDTVLEANNFTNYNVKVRIGLDQIALDQKAANLTHKKETNWEVQQNYTDKLDQLRDE
ncbi:MAG: hypothetical protein KAJ14_10855 [Candidatus Omnitrophica bacterium]|nr:hypothetical protein [Candidatus Omnitrophota bacterium]